MQREKALAIINWQKLISTIGLIILFYSLASYCREKRRVRGRRDKEKAEIEIRKEGKSEKGKEIVKKKEERSGIRND